MISALLDPIMYLATFVVVLSLVVFVHEFGHFQVAKWCGVAIEAFSIGFGKRLVSWKDKSGVEWKIGSLPLGGYVKFVDDSDPSSTLPQQAPSDPAELAAARRKGLYHAQPVASRAAVAAAGPAANFIFSILAFALLLMVFGRDATDEMRLSPRIDDVQVGSAADKAGLKSGDVVVTIADKKIGSWGAVKATVPEYAGKPVPIIIRRGDELLALTVTPTARKVMDETGVEHVEGVLGVSRKTAVSERVIEHPNPIAAVGGGAERVWQIISSTGAYLGNIFSGRASPEHIAGVVGMLDMTSQVTKGAISAPTFNDRVAALFETLIAWAATLSVAVGITNLLPIPILDGGHLLFYGIEAVRGRPLNAKTQLLGFRAGLALLGSLFLFATWNDLQRLNVLEFLRGIMS
jgi:regulator of sigma E protease